MKKRYLVTPALPYANGPIHLGHLLEHIQVNVFVRALRMAGNDVLYVCGADSHGTPIELNAQKAGLSPEAFIKQWQAAHASTFAQFHIAFDGGYQSTHSKEHEQQAHEVFQRLKQTSHIVSKSIEQLFDPISNRFLPDRMVKGICPKCSAPDQYGDSCEVCGSTYQPTDLKEPKSALSGATPILKSSEHYFFNLKPYANQLQAWAKEAGTVPEEIQKFLRKWFEEGLKDWDITRDGPYFGFLIPGETNKYLYVWVDAPIGYMTFAKQAAKELGKLNTDYFQDPNTEIIHFIGKDIAYFHTLFWPAMLMASGYTLPKSIAVHGMLTINGEKMSKSRGTFILADDFAKHISTEALRYYFASKMSDKIDDIDLNLEDLMARINADLVNNVVNLLSRTIPLLHRHFSGFVAARENRHALAEALHQAPKTIQALYHTKNTAAVTREVVSLASMANKYLQDNAPWNTLKTNPNLAHTQLSTALWAGKACIALLKPILPQVASQVEEMLCTGALNFHNATDDLDTKRPIQPYKNLFERIQPKQIEALMQTETNPAQAPKNADISWITIDDFTKVELRAARVLKAQSVANSDKLIALELDVGPFGIRHVLTGLRPHIAPEDLLNQMLVLVFNLKPRTMKFGTSEGMILAAGEPPNPILLHPETKAGDRVQ